MLAFIAISGITFVYIVYKNFNKENKNNLDEKINYYNTKRDNIDEDIEDHLQKIEDLKNEKISIDEKLTDLLTKKIIGFHKEHIKFNNKSVKKIKYLIDLYSNGNKIIENNIYDNIDEYIDIQQVKNCDISNYELDEISSDSNDEFITSSEDDVDDRDDVDDVDDSEDVDDDNVEDNVDDNEDKNGDNKDIPDKIVKIC